MSTFYVICAGLVLFSALFLFLPLRRAQDDTDPARANLQWWRTRSRELTEQDQAELVEDARLRLIEDEDQPHLKAAGVDATFPRWALFPLIALMATGFYYQLGSVADVKIADQLQAIEVDAAPVDVNDLMSAISKRSEQRPDNLHYIGLIARYSMGQADYASAANAYEKMLQSVPEDPQILAYAAQARYMSADRVLDDRARLYAEQALAANPRERTALGLLGMTSFEAGQYRDAVRYFERLVAMEAPGSEGAAIIEDVLARARAQLGAIAPAGLLSGDLDASGAITVSVRLPPGANVSPSDTVFVFARDAASSSRMPVAVQRRTAGELPITLRLDDGNSMAGRKLSALSALVVSAQVSPSGSPGAANSTWVATSRTVRVGDVVPLVLQPNTDSAGNASAVGSTVGSAVDSAVDATSPAELATVADPGVTVQVVLPAGAEVNPNDTVFVLARNAESDSRMPIAVQRLTGADLPITLRLDDASSMAGQRLSQIDSVIVAVQVSPSGRPGEASASWLGQAGPLAPSTSVEAVQIVLSPN